MQTDVRSQIQCLVEAACETHAALRMREVYVHLGEDAALLLQQHAAGASAASLSVEGDFPGSDVWKEKPKEAPHRPPVRGRRGGCDCRPRLLF